MVVPTWAIATTSAEIIRSTHMTIYYFLMAHSLSWNYFLLANVAAECIIDQMRLLADLVF